MAPHTATSVNAAAPASRLVEVFEAQWAGVAHDPYPDAATRIRRLRAVEDVCRGHLRDIATAVSRDFGHRSVHETLLFEAFPSLRALKHARRHVRHWMAPRRVPTAIWFRPGRSQVLMQPLGVVGIIVPWNYPLYLAVGPLAGALAAGNRVVLKMSRDTPATAALLQRLLREAVEEHEVAVLRGDEDVGHAMVRLPFDHFLFTGSTTVGRDIMGAAADQLTPVTLELGGKSPAIVGPGYPTGAAADRIVAGKCLNAGQTCIAPDYALVPRDTIPDFLAAARAAVARSYPDLKASADYSAIINDRHFTRLVHLLEDARAGGADVVELAPDVPRDPARRLFPPVALRGVRDDAVVMQEEICGPILPMVPYDTLDEAIGYVNARPRPLALYYFDNDSRRVDRVLRETWAGGITINGTILHIAQEDLPFGGVGASGMGAYHGYAGFRTFSEEKGIFRQSRWSRLRLLAPPYGPQMERILKVLLHRWAP